MWFWWYMLGINILISFIMLLAGWMMWKHTPQDINGVIGYRTARSMKNMEAWRFANSHCGKLWWKLGWILLVPCLLAYILAYGASQTTIATLGLILMALQIICLIVSIFSTENALKKAFPK